MAVGFGLRQQQINRIKEVDLFFVDLLMLARLNVGGAGGSWLLACASNKSIPKFRDQQINESTNQLPKALGATDQSNKKKLICSLLIC